MGKDGKLVKSRARERSLSSLAGPEKGRSLNVKAIGEGCFQAFTCERRRLEHCVYIFFTPSCTTTKHPSLTGFDLGKHGNTNYRGLN